MRSTRCAAELRSTGRPSSSSERPPGGETRATEGSVLNVSLRGSDGSTTAVGTIDYPTSDPMPYAFDLRVA